MHTISQEKLKPLKQYKQNSYTQEIRGSSFDNLSYKSIICYWQLLEKVNRPSYWCSMNIKTHYKISNGSRNWWKMDQLSNMQESERWVRGWFST